jgi:hypothetical protein
MHACDCAGTRDLGRGRFFRTRINVRKMACCDWRRRRSPFALDLILAGPDGPPLDWSKLCRNSLSVNGRLARSVGTAMLSTPLKMLVQHGSMTGLVPVLGGITAPLSSEAVLLCAFPTAIAPAMFALRYQGYEAEAAAKLLIITLAMIVVVPAAIALAGA